MTENIMDLYNRKGFHAIKNASHAHTKGRSMGAEYHGGCPKCGGEKRFILWPEVSDGGEFWCRDCGIGGDLLAWLTKVEGKPYREACASLGRDPVRKYSPSAHAKTYLPSQHLRKWEPRNPPPACDLWVEKAAGFVGWASRQLQKHPEIMDYLQKRGISKHTAERFNLGYNPDVIYRPRTAWGQEEVLDDQTGKLKPIWIPEGVVIPVYSNNRLCRVRIRRFKLRPDDKNKYINLTGSVSVSFNCNPAVQFAIITESELDTLAIHEAAGDFVSAVSTGSASTRPDASLHAFFQSCLKILVALDRDDAGEKNIPWYLERYRQAVKHLPVEGNKDPGDMVAKGINLREWVLSGLPQAVRFKMEKAVISMETPPQEKRVEPAEPAVPPKEEEKKDGVQELYLVMKEHKLLKIINTYDRLAFENPAYELPWNVISQVSDLIFHNKEVLYYIRHHPDDFITYSNLIIKN